MKKNVAVIFGGRSAEHDVSIITAHIPIIQSLAASGRYEAWPLYIAKDGTWYSDKALNDLNFFKKAGFERELRKLKPVQVTFTDGLVMSWPGFGKKPIRIEVVFPAMHGTYGEDGTLMGFMRLANVPFVGCDLAASVIAMDKVLTKQITEPLGIPSVPYLWCMKADWEAKKGEIKKGIAEKLHYPLFVKPVHLGSSIGITRVEGIAQLENAIELAFHYDDKVIVEQGVENLIEVTLPIMGNDELELAYPEQALVKFFDFEEKYLKGSKKGGGEGVNARYSNIPAEISASLTKRVEELGEMTYRAIGCTGIARVDFLIDAKTNEVFVNEVNTLPGSLYHHNWREKGVSGVALVGKLIELAEERYKQQQAITFDFQSEILSKVGGAKSS